MSSTFRKIATPAGVPSLRLGETQARKMRRAGAEIDPQPRPVSVAQIRRQREADEAVADAEATYGLRVTG